MASVGNIKSGAEPLSLAKFLGVGCDCELMQKSSDKVSTYKVRLLQNESFMAVIAVGLIRLSAKD